MHSTAWDSIYVTFWDRQNYRDRTRSVMGWGTGYKVTTKSHGGVLGVMVLFVLYLGFCGGYRLTFVQTYKTEH